jgi:hypothetical protein
MSGSQPSSVLLCQIGAWTNEQVGKDNKSEENVTNGMNPEDDFVEHVWVLQKGTKDKAKEAARYISLTTKP